jgi:hypothetical protein
MQVSQIFLIEKGQKISNTFSLFLPCFVFFVVFIFPFVLLAGFVKTTFLFACLVALEV